MRTIDRVLLVDDDKVTNFLNKDLIAKVGFAKEVIIKTNASEALSHLEHDCKKDKTYPDLIILDLKLPGMDGFEFLREFERLCRDIKLQTVIVILTTSRNPDDFIRLMDMGNYYLINKPLTHNHLIDILHRHFRDPNFGIEQFA